MNDEHFIRPAIEEANKFVAANSTPINAVLVKKGEVIATAWSLVWSKKDPSKNRVEVVTGLSTGIGQVVALELAKQAAFLCSDESKVTGKVFVMKKGKEPYEEYHT